MNNKFIVNIGRHRVPLHRAEFPTLLRFSGGKRGRHEKGIYAMWTAVCVHPVKIDQRRPCRNLIGRCRAWFSPSERFERMAREMRTADIEAGRLAYKQFWVTILQRGKNVKHIRPSTRQECMKWLLSHKEDARFLRGLEIC